MYRKQAHTLMKLKIYLLLFGLPALLLASCQTYSEDQESQSLAIDTLLISDLEPIVSSESALLGEPREIVSIHEYNFAVYDHAHKKKLSFLIMKETSYMNSELLGVVPENGIQCRVQLI